MYKDKGKQREANRQASQRQRDKKGMTDDCAKAGIVIPDHPVPVIPKRGKDIKCFEDLPVDVQATINRLSESNEEKAKRTAAAIKYQHLFPDSFSAPSDLDFTRLMAQAGPGHVRVSKPGDDDCGPQCEMTKALAFVDNRDEDSRLIDLVDKAIIEA